MRLLVSWVRDFVDVTARPEEIADKLALRGFEVASIEPTDQGDAVIDFEVTANRPDCLSVLGLAREIATVYGLPLRTPSTVAGAPIALATIRSGESDRLLVTIEEPDLCPRYAAAVAEIVPTSSPDWMVSRLLAAGVRSIGPIVDITNYVLMEIGHPLHAFDLDVLAGRELRIRRASAGEPITTLDATSRALDHEMLVIADAEKPQAIAGVMGGAGSEVSPATRTVAFESAYFKPSSVRRTSKRLGLKTEAAFRFERGADIGAPVVALQRAIALMEQIGAGRFIAPLVDRYPRPQNPRAIGLRRTRLASLLGLHVPDEEVVRILEALGLGVTRAAEGWETLAPTFRVDLVREIDLIEEIGRHYGFDKLEPAFPALTHAPAPPDPRTIRDRLARRVLTASGLSEAVTFGIIEASAAEPFLSGEPEELVPIANPLSAKFDSLRPSLLPGLLDALAHNRRHGRRDVALFEIGARFRRSNGETQGVALAWTGRAGPEHWDGNSREVDFFDVKGVMELLCQGLAGEVRIEPAERPHLVGGQAAAVVTARGSTIGALGQLQPTLVASRGAPLPRYPSVVRDLSIVVADTLPAEIIRGTIQAAAEGAAPLVAVAFFDRYKGKGIAEGSVSISVHLTFQAVDRTLIDAEVQQTVDTILAALVARHGAVQR
jgi:phenylalanyl-tRNA synthetase beta chain